MERICTREREREVQRLQSGGRVVFVFTWRGSERRVLMKVNVQIDKIL